MCGDRYEPKMMVLCVRSKRKIGECSLLSGCAGIGMSQKSDGVVRSIHKIHRRWLAPISLCGSRYEPKKWCCAVIGISHKRWCCAFDSRYKRRRVLALHCTVIGNFQRNDVCVRFKRTLGDGSLLTGCAAISISQRNASIVDSIQ